MADREKVIKGVECHRKKVQTSNVASCLKCPYAEPKPISEWCMHGLMDDIYALLKEHKEHEELLTKLGYHWTGSRKTLALCKKKEGGHE